MGTSPINLYFPGLIFTKTLAQPFLLQITCFQIFETSFQATLSRSLPSWSSWERMGSSQKLNKKLKARHLFGYSDTKSHHFCQRAAVKVSIYLHKCLQKPWAQLCSLQKHFFTKKHKKKQNQFRMTVSKLFHQPGSMNTTKSIFKKPQTQETTIPKIWQRNRTFCKCHWRKWTLHCVGTRFYLMCPELEDMTHKSPHKSQREASTCLFARDVLQTSCVQERRLQTAHRSCTVHHCAWFVKQKQKDQPLNCFKTLRNKEPS